jgi:hypothetical protein
LRPSEGLYNNSSTIASAHINERGKASTGLSDVVDRAITLIQARLTRDINQKCKNIIRLESWQRYN